MTFDRIVTAAAAIAGVAALYGASVRILKGRAASALVVLPIIFGIPWGKRFPATDDALSFFAAAAIIRVWLYAREEGAGKLKRALAGATAVILIKPEVLYLAAAAAIIEGWHWRRAVGLRWTVLAPAAVAAAGIVSVVVTRFVYSPGFAIEGLEERLVLGTAWDGSNWIFSGTNIRNSLKPALTYGTTFYFALLAPFAALAYRYRKEWWFGPVFWWSGVMLALTLWKVREPVFRACPPMAAGLVVAFGVTGVRRLSEEFPALLRHLGCRGGSAAQPPTAS